MKHLLGYVIWNKVNLLPWIIDGIVQSFTPEQIDIMFVLDDPKDGSDQALLNLIHSRLKPLGFTVIGIQVFDKPTYKFPCQNWMMDYAANKANFITGDRYKTLICPQDDQKIIDPDLIQNIDHLIDVEHIENVGVIGLRDGFSTLDYTDMVSTHWSESNLSNIPRLDNGEYVNKRLINDGGIVYPITTIKKIGFNDVEHYKRFYIEVDYAARAHGLFGLKNYVLGNKLIHRNASAEATFASDHYNSNFGEIDLKTYKSKWRH